ncbi:MAG: TonB-dependent receptor [candidate division Zixibacteria bacterium]|nr:TonB-dependent receptor [candidate division Zixibacteria bacterium]
MPQMNIVISLIIFLLLLLFGGTIFAQNTDGDDIPNVLDNSPFVALPIDAGSVLLSLANRTENDELFTSQIETCQMSVNSNGTSRNIFEQEFSTMNRTPSVQTQNGSVLQGYVIDSKTLEPLVGASVSLVNVNKIISTDSIGHFHFTNLTIGTYEIRTSYVGYATDTITGINIALHQVVRLNISLMKIPIKSKDVIVVGDSSSISMQGFVSVKNFSEEEIIQQPGSFGDIGRVLSKTVGVSQISDIFNNLIVRGGSPIENTFYIDNIEMSNINHFPSQNSGGGPLSLLRTDLVDCITISTGGYPAEYGNCLSSVTDISLRNGDRDRFHGAGAIDMAGANATVEGPIRGGHGDWLLSTRIGLLNEVIDIEGEFDYSDLIGKVTLDYDSLSTVTLLAVIGIGNMDLPRKLAYSARVGYCGKLKYTTGTFGVNWDRHWNHGGLSQTSLAYTSADWENDNSFTSTDRLLYDNQSNEQSIALRTVHHIPISSHNTASFGFETEYTNHDYDYTIGSFSSPQGYVGFEDSVDEEISTLTYSMYIGHIWQPWRCLKTSAGLRIDRSEYNGNTHLSPRFAVTYYPDDMSSYYIAAGVYNQFLPLTISLLTEEGKFLKDLRAVHLIAGVEKRLNNSIHLVLEGYWKTYSNMPADSALPTAFLLDELIKNYGFLSGHNNINNSGKAYAKGIEFSGSFVMGRRLSGNFSATYSSAKYRDGNGDLRRRTGDNKYTANISLTYSPTRSWVISANWFYGGGLPYTLYDIEKSERYNYPFYDTPHINEAQFPNYHSLTLRCERHFVFNQSELVLYVDLMNAYNRYNINEYYWDTKLKAPEGYSDQLPRLFIVGVSYRL